MYGNIRVYFLSVLYYHFLEKPYILYSQIGLLLKQA